MVYVLPTFNGYTVDLRLGQFRKVNRENKTMEFIEFESDEGRAIIEEVWILSTALGAIIQEIDREMGHRQTLKERLGNTVARIVTKLRGR